MTPDPIKAPIPRRITPEEARAALLKTAPLAEIIAELERRFPAFVLAYNAREPGAQHAGTTVARFSREGLHSDLLGLAHVAVVEIERSIRDSFGVAAGPLPELKKG